MWNFIGATQSHLNCRRKALDEGASSVTIAEDDCNLVLAASKTRKVLAELKAWLSTRKWLTVQLGAHPPMRHPAFDSATRGEKTKPRYLGSIWLLFLLSKAWFCYPVCDFIAFFILMQLLFATRFLSCEQ